ncbi:olfactory receptor 8H1-like [Erpetoichthys calabaricus]|uniref:olfactory receptor 8H1-like n=1 Tax=Erpetoichthys calabaricus TaxID=27687 RepID=UPI002234BFD8|nr:olfactory receptor 8H1-like [Erpetoichthys calabaricus]
MNASNANVNNSSLTGGFLLTASDALGTKTYRVIIFSLVYVITLLGNGTVLLVVFFDKSLHTPKHFSICNLALVDIGLNTVFIPQVVSVLIFTVNFISFEGCFSQMFFIHFFGDMGSFSLAILAYDRLIAICFPLHYSSLNTNFRMILIIAGTWALVFCSDMYQVLEAAKLPYCSSRIIRGACCEHGLVYVLACIDTSFNRKLGTAKTLFALLCPLCFIISTYIIIVVIVLKIASVEQRQKAFQTCLSHLLFVCVYYIPIMLVYILSNLRLIVSFDVLTSLLILSVILPPMINPIIYWFNTEELKEKLLNVLKRNKTFPR